MKLINNSIITIRNEISNLKWSEHRKIGGIKNKEVCFYVIRRRSKDVGLFSYVLSNLGHIKYAEEKNWIPVIDMKNYPNSYLEKNVKENAWEYFFMQPRGYRLEDIKYSRNIILSSGDTKEPYPGYEMLKNENILNEWKKIYKDNIHINYETQDYIEQIEKEVFKGHKNILGVLCRGTDYVALQPQGHPRQPEVQQVITKVKNVMENRNFEYVYLATEDSDILEEFKKIFKEKLFFVNVPLRKYDRNKLITQIEIDRANDKIIKGKEYLGQVYLLSKCRGIIAAGCGGTYGALLMNTQYEYKFFWDLGVY